VVDVELDLRSVDVKIRRTRVLYRTEWLSIMRKAEAKLKGCTAKEEEVKNIILIIKI
jgi:hypothetical protein